MCIRDRIKVRREPQRMANKESVNAKMWYSGRAAILLIWLGGPTRSSAGANQASACNTAATILRCVNTAPLERPVVPPVYCKKATESSVLGAAWNGSAQHARLGRFFAIHRRNYGPLQGRGVDASQYCGGGVASRSLV